MVSLLIVCLALVMLAAMMNASAYSIRESKKKLAEYYKGNNEINLFSSDASMGSADIFEEADVTPLDSVSIEYFENSSQSSRRIISFRISE